MVLRGFSSSLESERMISSLLFATGVDFGFGLRLEFWIVLTGNSFSSSASILGGKFSGLREVGGVETGTFCFSSF